MSDAEIRELAYKIAQRLFTNGANQKGDRLVMMDKENRDLGGWDLKPATDQIEKVIKEFQETK